MQIYNEKEQAEQKTKQQKSEEKESASRFNARAKSCVQK